MLNLCVYVYVQTQLCERKHKMKHVGACGIPHTPGCQCSGWEWERRLDRVKDYAKCGHLEIETE